MSAASVVVAACSLVFLAAGCRTDRSSGQGPYAREVAEAIPRIEQATGLRFKSPPTKE